MAIRGGYSSMVMFICEHCKWNYRTACWSSKRPNLTIEDGCKDFEPKDSNTVLFSPGSMVYKKIKGNKRGV